jgi:hypothetical protein
VKTHEGQTKTTTSKKNLYQISIYKEIDEQLLVVPVYVYYELLFSPFSSTMNFNRNKHEQQKPGHPQQRRSIAEGMARTGISYVQLENTKINLFKIFCVI